MLKILIVEDDSTKLRNVLQLIEKNPRIDSNLIHHELDIVSAKKRLKDSNYDLLIVDIAIPNRKAEAIDMSGGIKLVEEVLHRDIYNVPTHIIGLTALNEAFEEAFKKFSSKIISVIRYSDSDIEWEGLLDAGINKWIDSKQSSNREVPNYNYDIAILTAVDIEFDAVKALNNGNWSSLRITQDSTNYWETTLQNDDKSFRIVCACLPQMGMVASAAYTMKIINNFRPKYLFMPGICASLKDNETHGYGDVLIIDECWDGGAGKIGKDDKNEYTFEPVALHLRLDPTISDAIRTIKEDKNTLRLIKDSFQGTKPNTELNVHIGSVVTVAGVIANEEISHELKGKDRKLLGLEMEGYGVYYSAFNSSLPKPHVLALKSVCDFANSKKNDAFQNYSAYTSAQVMLKIILENCTPIS